MFALVTAEIILLCHPPQHLAWATPLSEIPDLDSFKMVELVLRMEQALGLEVDFARLEHLHNVEDVVAAFSPLN